MSYVSLAGISKRYGSMAAVKQLDLTLERGEFFSLLGPSGCGKTTTLRMLAGFVQPSSGRILIAGRDITDLPPEFRDIGIVFQNYAIFPHLSVFDNIAFGLRMRKKSPDQIRTKVEQALEQVGLVGFGGRFERELSGGQKQRVALARVLVTEPQILLLDEPLSALDKKMREEMKVWIKDMQKSIGITTLYVTHDQGEALTMSDRIAVMNAGEVLQIGSPEQIYEAPINRFIGEFIGDSNWLDGVIVNCHETYCEIDLGETTISAKKPSQSTVSTGDKVAVLVRPEAIRLLPRSAASTGHLGGIVLSETYQGANIRLLVQAGSHRLIAEVPNRPDTRHLNTGDSVSLHWDNDSAVVLQ